MPDQGRGDAHRHRAPRERSQGASTSQSRASITATSAASTEDPRAAAKSGAEMNFKRLLMARALSRMPARWPRRPPPDDGRRRCGRARHRGPGGEPSAAAERARSGGAGAGRRARAGRPRRPEGEEQPPGEEQPDGEQPPRRGGRPGGRADRRRTPGGEAAAGDASRAPASSSLALAMIGLGLLLAGAALWPDELVAAASRSPEPFDAAPLGGRLRPARGHRRELGRPVDRPRHQLVRGRDLDAEHLHAALQRAVGEAVDLARGVAVGDVSEASVT